MHKPELVEEVLENRSAELKSRAAAKRVVNAVIKGITAGIKKDGFVQLIGFGAFTVKSRAARKGRNPQTGEEIDLKAFKNVSFKAGTALNEVAMKARIKKD